MTNILSILDKDIEKIKDFLLNLKNINQNTDSDIIKIVVSGNEILVPIS